MLKALKRVGILVALLISVGRVATLSAQQTNGQTPPGGGGGEFECWQCYDTGEVGEYGENNPFICIQYGHEHWDGSAGGKIEGCSIYSGMTMYNGVTRYYHYCDPFGSMECTPHEEELVARILPDGRYWYAASYEHAVEGRVAVDCRLWVLAVKGTTTPIHAPPPPTSFTL